MTASRCSNCGEAAVSERTVPFTVNHGAKSMVIQDRQTICSECGNVSYIGKQISEHELAVAAAIREMDGLLSAEELLQIRLKYRLKQIDMEQMLATGPKTWTRWERGKVPQSKATDKLIRLIAEDPEVARKLMEQSGVENAEAAAVFARIEEDSRRMARAVLREEYGLMQGVDADQMACRMADKAFETVRDARQKAAARAEAA